MKKLFKIKRKKLKLTTFAFTLIELIGVIILLSMLALIAIPRVIEEIEKTKNLATDQQISVLKESGLLYSVKFDLGYEDNITKTIDFDTLVNSGFLKEETILNEKGNRIEGCLKYKWFNNSNQYEFWYDKECIDVLYDDINPTVVFSVVGEPFNANGWAKTDFYVSIEVLDLESGSHSYKWCSGINDCEPVSLVEESSGNVLISTEHDDIVVCAIGYDVVGNASEKTCGESYKLDKTNPVLEGINDLIVNKDDIVDLTLDIIASDSVSGIDGTYSYNPTSVDTSIAGTTNITYSVSDMAGNETIITRKIIVDAEAPTVIYTALGDKINANGWSKEDFFVEALLVDRSGLGIRTAKWCSTTNDTCTPIADMVGSSMTPLISTESNNNRICIQATDNNNKTSEVICSDSYKLDKTAPVAGTINVSGTLGSNNWYTTNVTLNSTNGSDALSGHNTTTLNISSITSNTTGTTVIVTTTDKAGNTSNNSKLIKIDKDSPNVSFSTNGNSTYKASHDTTVTVSDAYSAVNTSSLKYIWSTSTSTPSEGSFSSSFSNGGRITNSSGVNGGYYLWILAKDQAGNSTIIRTNVFNIDSTNPIISFSMNGNSTYATSRNTTITVTDAHSGVGTSSTSLRYIWNTSTSAPSEATFTGYSGSIFSNGANITSPSGVNGGYYLWVLARDKAGNTTITRTNIFNLDSVAPTVSFGTNGNSTYANTRSTTVSVSDSLSGINTSSLKYRWIASTSSQSESSFTTSFSNGYTINSTAGLSGTYYLWILAKDKAGNKIMTHSNAFNLDNAAPVVSNISLSATSVNLTSFSISRSGSASDANSGLPSNPYIYQISTNNSTWTTKCTTSFSYCDVTGLSQGTKYYFRVCVKDKIGNENCTQSKETTTLTAFYNKFTNGSYFQHSATNNYVKIGSSIWRVMYRNGTSVRAIYSSTSGTSSFGSNNYYSSSPIKNSVFNWCSSKGYNSYGSCDIITKREIECIMSSRCSQMNINSRVSGYLYISGAYYWTQTASTTGNVYYVDNSGPSLKERSCTLSSSIRPTITIPSSVKTSGGTGTSSNPYILQP